MGFLHLSTIVRCVLREQMIRPHHDLSHRRRVRCQSHTVNTVAVQSVGKPTTALAWLGCRGWVFGVVQYCRAPRRIWQICLQEAKTAYSGAWL
jgi:hypothetical protein